MEEQSPFDWVFDQIREIQSKLDHLHDQVRGVTEMTVNQKITESEKRMLEHFSNKSHGSAIAES